MTTAANTSTATPTLRNWLEYLAIRSMLVPLTWLPRGSARNLGSWLGSLVHRIASGLNRTGRKNLEVAFPDMDTDQRNLVLSRMYRNLGWLLAEFAQMRRYSKEYAQQRVIRYEGLQNYLDAAARGKGVLVLTGHLGAWELSSFVHSLFGWPMGMVIRRLDNPLVDNFVNGIRCMHGNRVLHKDDFARGLLRAMQMGETVGILMDTNMTPPQGVFVPFFGRDACTASGLARVARKTGAAVVPGFLLWNDLEQKYVLTFGKELHLVRTDDTEADALSNTALFARVTEEYIRTSPDQWLWLHRRWKTRPDGEAPVYHANTGSTKTARGTTTEQGA